MVPSGLAQPARHRISERVVRAVRASQARAAHRSSGTWGGWPSAGATRLAKIGRVAREAKGMRCVAFLWPKAMGTTGNAHRSRLQLFGETNAKTFPALHENGVSLGGRETEPRLLEARKAEGD